MIGIRAAIVLLAVAISSTAGAQDADLLAEGAQVFRKCAACHTLGEGERNKVGPNLWGMFGREAATAEGFTRYSKAMKESGIVWDDARLDTYLESPRKAVPGTNMAFVGIRKPEDREKLITFLRAETGAPPAPENTTP